MALSEQNIQSRFFTKFEKANTFVDTPNNTIQGFIFSLKCEGFGSVFQHEDHSIIFKDRNLWLFIDNTIGMATDVAIEKYRSAFDQLNALPISDLFIAKRIQHESIQWLLFDMYKIDTDFDIFISSNGMVDSNPKNKLSVIDADFLAYRRKNLNGLTISCGLVLAYPEKFTYFDDPATDHLDVFTKGSIKLANNLREDLNMSCQVLQVDSYGWLTNGTFNGVMGLFQKKKIRMTLHGINMRKERLLFSEFTGNMFTPRTPLIFRQPPLSTVTNIFLLPLSSEVWISIFIVLIIVILVMVIQFMHPFHRTSMTLFDIVTFILGAFCQQGTHLNIPNLSGRLIVMTIFLTSVALFTSYSASIVALLQSPSNYIKTIDNLIASPMKVGLHEAGYMHYYVKSNFSGISEIYKKKIEPQGAKGWIYDPFVGIERVRTELFAFILDSPSAYKAIHRTYTDGEKCGITEFQLIVLPVSTIAVERNSGYKELLKQRIAWQKEIGLIQRDEARWIPKKPECISGHSGFITVGLSVIKPAIGLLLAGFALSVLIALVEWVCARISQRIKHKKTS